MLKLQNISKSIDNKLLLDDINIDLPDTGLVVIKGENGSGKTTLINLIGGLDNATRGDIIFNNSYISQLSEKELSKYREKYISFMPQTDCLFDNLSGKDNITLMGNEISDDKILDLLNIKNFLNSKSKYLSGGEKQKISFIRAINKNTKILICDEPTSSMDIDSKQMVFDSLKKISSFRLVIVVTHDHDLVDSIADVILELRDGKLYTSHNSSNIINQNNILPFKNRFTKTKFTFSAFFVNKKIIFINTLLLLLSFTFILISFSLASLDYNKLHISAVSNEKNSIIFFDANSKDPYTGIYYSSKNFESEDIDYINKNKISDSPLIIGKKVNVDGGPMNFGIKYNHNVKIPYFQKIISSLSFFNINDLTKIDYGRKPTAPNEIVISSYLADIMMFYGVMTEDKTYYTPKTYDELVSVKNNIILGTNTVNIVGIYNIDLDNFETLKKEYADLSSVLNSLQLFDETIDNLAGNIYVLEDFFDLYSDTTPVVTEYSFSLTDEIINGRLEILGSDPIVLDKEIELLDGSSINNIGLNEIIVNTEILTELKIPASDCLGKNITLYAWHIFSDYMEPMNLTIKGVSKYNDYYMSAETLEKYTDKVIYTDKVFIYENDENIIQNIFNSFPIENSQFTIHTNYSHFIIGLKGAINFIAKIFLVINIIFIILLVISLINYIFNNIELHKKDIAILKIFGIDEKEIQSMFIIELLILVFGAYIFSLILFIILKYAAISIINKIFLVEVDLLPMNLIYICLTFVIIILFINIIFYTQRKKLENISPIALFKNDNSSK